MSSDPASCLSSHLPSCGLTSPYYTFDSIGRCKKRDIDISRRKQSQHAQCLNGQAKERLNNEANSEKYPMIFGLMPNVTSTGNFFNQVECG